jgi:hypothetical protein
MRILVILLAIAGLFLVMSFVITVLKWLAIAALVLFLLSVASFFRQRRRQ